MECAGRARRSSSALLVVTKERVGVPKPLAASAGARRPTAVARALPSSGVDRVDSRTAILLPPTLSSPPLTAANMHSTMPWFSARSSSGSFTHGTACCYLHRARPATLLTHPHADPLACFRWTARLPIVAGATAHARRADDRIAYDA
jgi:hypothetical protein